MAVQKNKRQSLRKKMSVSENDPIVAQVYEQSKSWAEGDPPSIASVVSFVTQLITTVQSMVTEKAKGPYKKQVVLTVLRKILENDVQWGSEADEATIMRMLETTVPSIIDTAVGIATGEIDLEKRARKIGRIWKACFPCCC